MDTKIPVIKASFRNNAKDCFKPDKISDVTLIISPGQPYHEGEKFKSTIELVNRSNFRKCYIMIGDSNYRHTLKIHQKISDNQAYELALATGNAWLERNNQYIEMLTCDYEIIRWDSLLAQPDYSTYRKAVDKIFSDDLVVRDSFLYSAKNFIARCQKGSMSELEYNKAVNYCLEYLLEECAIIMPLWSSRGNHTYVYPQKMLKAMDATYTALVEPHREIRWLSLRFKKKYVEPTEALFTAS